MLLIMKKFSEFTD